MMKLELSEISYGGQSHIKNAQVSLATISKYIVQVGKGYKDYADSFAEQLKNEFKEF